MNNLRNKILTIALSVLMIFSSFPINIINAEDNYEENIVENINIDEENIAFDDELVNDNVDTVQDGTYSLQELIDSLPEEINEDNYLQVIETLYEIENYEISDNDLEKVDFTHYYEIKELCIVYDNENKEEENEINNSDDDDNDEIVQEDNFAYGHIDDGIDTSLLKHSTLNMLAKAPVSYDLRDYGAVTSIKNQGSYGTCWAHAAVASAESYALKHNVASSIDLSELQLAYFAYHNYGKSDNLSLITNDGSYWSGPSVFNEGGNIPIATYSLASNVGYTYDSDLPYSKISSNPSYSSSLCYNSNDYYVTNVEWINMSETSLIKSALMNYGALSISYYDNHNSSTYYNSSNAAYYYPSSSGTNHAVTLIGWDDNYSKYNFSLTPSGNGAWLVKNSWGTTFGKSGYFWISYYDVPLRNGVAASYQIEKYDPDIYVYQYDGSGSANYRSSSSTYYGGNVFTAKRSELLNRVGFATMSADVSYTISVYSNVSSTPTSGTLVTSQSGIALNAGYHSIVLDEPVLLQAGKKFSIVLKVSKVSSNVELAFDYQTSSNYTDGTLYFKNSTSSGQSYWSTTGTSWTDCYSESSTVRIKAYTTSANFELNAYSKALDIGDTFKLSLNTNISGTRIWSSSNESIATVSSDGTVKAISPGTCYIYVDFAGCSLCCQITVRQSSSDLFDYFEVKDNGDIYIYGNNDWLNELSSNKSSSLIKLSNTKNTYVFTNFNKETSAKELIKYDGYIVIPFEKQVEKKVLRDEYDLSFITDAYSTYSAKINTFGIFDENMQVSYNKNGNNEISISSTSNYINDIASIKDSKAFVLIKNEESEYLFTNYSNNDDLLCNNDSTRIDITSEKQLQKNMLKGDYDVIISAYGYKQKETTLTINGKAPTVSVSYDDTNGLEISSIDEYISRISSITIGSHKFTKDRIIFANGKATISNYELFEDEILENSYNILIENDYFENVTKQAKINDIEIKNPTDICISETKEGSMLITSSDTKWLDNLAKIGSYNRITFKDSRNVNYPISNDNINRIENGVLVELDEVADVNNRKYLVSMKANGYPVCSENIVLNNRYSSISDVVYVDFYSNGGLFSNGEDVYKTQINYNGILPSCISMDPPGIIYNFDGWYDANGIKYDEKANVTKDVELFAKWKSKYQVNSVSASEVGEIEKDTKVYLKTSTIDARIYYTIDGSDPVSNGILYVDGIRVSEATTIKAVAIKEGQENSEISTFVYTIKSDETEWGDIAEEDREIYPGKGLWVGKIEDDYYYSGKAILLNNGLRVYDNKKLLLSGTDYTVKYKNNINAAKDAAICTITFKNNYSGSTEKTFTINPLDISDTVSISGTELFYYSGKAQSIKPVVKNNKTTLKLGKDYTVTTKDNDGNVYASVVGVKGEICDYTVEIEGINNYSFEKEYNVRVVDRTNVSKLKVTLEYTKVNYDGSQKQPKLTIMDGTQSLSVDDFNIVYDEDCISSGKHYLTITPISDDTYYGSVTKEYSIVGFDISKAVFSKIDSSYFYTGEEICPKQTLSSKDGTPFTEGVDYKVEYQNNYNIGTATILYSGLGKCSGQAKKTFKIVGYQISKAKFEPIQNQIYNGLEIEPNQIITFVGNDGKIINLRNGIDYISTFTKNTNVGTATIKYTGIGRFSGSASKTFKIVAKPISNNDINIQTDKSAKYSKANATIDINIVDDEGKALVLNKDYTVKYVNNNRIGVANVAIKGKGNYSDSVTKYFNVEKQNISNLSITAKDVVVSKKANYFKVSPTIADNGKALKAGTDYDKALVYTYAFDTVLDDGTSKTQGSEVGANDLIPVGTVLNVTAYGINNYTDSITGTYRIISSDISKASVTVCSQVYTGKKIEPSKNQITVKVGKYILKNNEYEIVEYRNNINKGSGTVVLKGIGNYGGTKEVKFTISNKFIANSIIFNGNSSTKGSMKTISLKNGINSTYLTKNAFVRNGYTFIGWNTRDDGTGISYNDQDLVEIDGKAINLVLYAMWDKDIYSINLDANGGTFDDDNHSRIEHYSIDTDTFNLPIPKKKGYSFVGWYSGSKKVTSINYGTTGNMNLVGKWTEGKYKISYVLEKGVVLKNKPSSYIYEQSDLCIDSPTRAGYSFAGWYKDSGFNEKLYNNTIVHHSEGDITLYPKWNRVYIESLSITGDNYITPGKSTTLKVNALPNNIVIDEYIWKSSDENLATVSNGIVTAKMIDTAKDVEISVDCVQGDSHFEAKKTLSILPVPSSVTIYRDGENITGKTLSLDSSESSSPIEISAVCLPNGTNQYVKWSSSNTSIVTIDSDGNLQLKGVNGTAKITASSAANSAINASFSINVQTMPQSLSITGKDTVKADSSITLSTSFLPNNTSNKKVTWSSSDTSVATVNSSGVVTGKNVARLSTVTITATSVAKPEVYATYDVTVIPKYALVYSDDKVDIFYSKLVSGRYDNGVEFVVNNKTNITITIQADAVSINGFSTHDIIMSDKVAPQSTGTVIADTDFFDVSTNVGTISGQLRVIDFSKTLFNSYDATFCDVVINPNVIIEEYIPNKTMVYSDQYVDIYFSRLAYEKYNTGVEFLVRNKTDILVTIQVDSISINGYGTDRFIMSDDISPHSIGTALAQTEYFSKGTIVERMSGQLRVIDFNKTLFKSYDALFTNVYID